MEEREVLYGLLLKSDGRGEIVVFEDRDKLGWWYKLLDCSCVDIVDPYGLNDLADKNGLKSIPGRYCIVVDDEGLFKPEPRVNPIGSMLYGADTHGQPLVGDVLVAKNLETEDGIETVGMTAAEINMLSAAINGLIELHNEKVREANGERRE